MGGEERRVALAARSSTLATSPSTGYYAPVAQSGGIVERDRREVTVVLGVSPSTAVRQPPIICFLPRSPFCRPRRYSTFQGAIPVPRATPRTAPPGRGCALTCGWTCGLAVPRAEPTHRACETRACVRLKARLRGVEPERAGLRRRALASVRRVRATSVLIGVSRSVPCGPRLPRAPHRNVKFAASFSAPRRDAPWNRRSRPVPRTLAIYRYHLNNDPLLTYDTLYRKSLFPFIIRPRVIK